MDSNIDFTINTSKEIAISDSNNLAKINTIEIIEINNVENTEICIETTKIKIFETSEINTSQFTACGR